MSPLDEAYEQLLDPKNFVKGFASMEHFRLWAQTGGYDDLEEAIKSFESCELYEHCAIMKNVQKSKDEL